MPPRVFHCFDSFDSKASKATLKGTEYKLLFKGFYQLDIYLIHAPYIILFDLLNPSREW